MTLTDEYRSRLDGCRRKKTTNNLIATVLYAVALIASAAATISAAVGTVPNEAVALLAVIPGIVTLALSMFKFDARSQWWSAKEGKLDDLLRALKHEGMSERKASQELTLFLKEHEPRYPGLGSPP